MDNEMRGAGDGGQHQNYQANNSILQEVETIAIQSGHSISTYPLDYVKTLIQLGYEPFCPVERPGFLTSNTYLALPNVSEYLLYVKNVDGFAGCYRGLGPRLCQNIVQNAVYRHLISKYPWNDGAPRPDEPNAVQYRTIRSGAWTRSALGEVDEDLVITLKNVGWDIVCVTASAIASHPFYVVAVRTMGQFVGRETIYNSLFQSFSYIYENEGISGFFAGLLPRIIGDVLYIGISASLVYLTTSYVGNQSRLEQVSAMCANVVANSCAYRFQVIATVMAANTSGLAIGRYPYTLKYDGWYECYKDLAKKKQLKRGGGIVGREFMGQIILIDGTKRPQGFHFGPVHPPDLGAREQLKNNNLKPLKKPSIEE